MATEYVTVEVWVMVDEVGQYVAHEDEGALPETWTDRIGNLEDCEGVRRVKLTVKVPLPTVIELSGEVTADESAAGLAVA